MLLLDNLDPGDELFLYLATSSLAMGIVLIHEWNKIQRPIYHVSQILRNMETRYSKLEKMVYALLIVARKLRPFF